MPALPPPVTGHGSPARITATLAALLARHGITRTYTAACHLVGVTACTNGRQLWITRNGQRETWPATGTQAAADRLVALARPGTP